MANRQSSTHRKGWLAHWDFSAAIEVAHWPGRTGLVGTLTNTLEYWLILWSTSQLYGSDIPILWSSMLISQCLLPRLTDRQTDRQTDRLTISVLAMTHVVEAAPKSQSLASRVSNNQAVFLRASASSGSVWFFQKTTHGKDGSLNRILAKGSPVLVDTEVG